jgi:hypothetical protein
MVINSCKSCDEHPDPDFRELFEMPNGSRVERLSLLASREEWCWNLHCTTCGHMVFRLGLLALARDLDPESPDWSVHWPVPANRLESFENGGYASGRMEENRQDLDRMVDRITSERVQSVALGQLMGPLLLANGPSWVGVDEWYVGRCSTALTGNPV